MGQIVARLSAWADGAAADAHWATRRHIKNLRGTRRRVRWRRIVSTACCVTCLMKPPQHPMSCGHAVCDDCVPRFGRRRCTQEYSYLLTICPLCGARVTDQHIVLKPPTAGLRILNIDGGGPRGVIPLEMMRKLQQTLGPGQRIQDYFDIAFGVSAGASDLPLPVEFIIADRSTGGLIVAALFGMRWDVAECMDRFRRSVTETLGNRPYGHLPLFSSVCDLIHSIRTGAVHSADSVALALQDCFGEQSRLFEPAGDGAPRSKFVITATTTRKASTIIFPNYNAEVDDAGRGDVVPTDDSSSAYRRFVRDRPQAEPRMWQV